MFSHYLLYKNIIKTFILNLQGCKSKNREKENFLEKSFKSKIWKRKTFYFPTELSMRCLTCFSAKIIRILKYFQIISFCSSLKFFQFSFKSSEY